MSPFSATPPTQSSGALEQASNWLVGTLLGPLGTALAVLSIAFLGFEMLAGRLSLKRGGVVILGCFILFGAPAIAAGLMNAVRGTGYVPPPAIAVAPAPPAPRPSLPPARDPYAGASLPQ